MFTNTLNRPATLLSVLTLSAALAAPALAETAANKPGPSDRLPAVEETIVVTEVDLQPITLASKILDSDAYLKDGTKIGDVTDLVLDQNNRATAVVVGVGGFLGVDETQVAIPISKIAYEQDGGNFKVIANVTKAELKKAQKTT